MSQPPLLERQYSDKGSKRRSMRHQKSPQPLVLEEGSLLQRQYSDKGPKRREQQRVKDAENNVDLYSVYEQEPLQDTNHTNSYFGREKLRKTNKGGKNNKKSKKRYSKRRYH